MRVVATLLAGSDGLSEFQRALRDQLRQGGSIGEFFLVVVGLVASGCLIHLLAKRRRRAGTGHEAKPDPQRLFGEVLEKLSLSPAQRDLLKAIARSSRFKHPTALLLSEALFDRHAAMVPGDTAPSDFAHLRRRLFP